jgi:hypothetical protein
MRFLLISYYTGVAWVSLDGFASFRAICATFSDHIFCMIIADLTALA